MADATKKLTHTAEQIDAAVGMLLEVYTREEIDALLAQKITSVPGSGLITDDEREKLANLENYDDTEVKSQTALNRSTLGYQRKNLLKNTAVSNTQNGVTFTVNADGSVTINGTNAGTNSVYITLNSKFITTYGRKYTASIAAEEIPGVYMSIYDSSWAGVGRCTTSITFVENKNSTRNIRLTVEAGTTLENVTLYPMLRYAEITDDTYEPYKPSVEERLAVLEEKFAALEGGGT